METWIVLAAIGVFAAGVFIYVMFMVFLPEWVGITGKKAIEAERSHQGGAPAGPDVLDRWQEKSAKPGAKTDDSSKK